MGPKSIFKCCMCKGDTSYHLGVLLEHIAIEHEEIALYQCKLCDIKFFSAAFASYHVKCNHKSREGIITTIDPTKLPLDKLKNVYEKYATSICPDPSSFKDLVKFDRPTQTDPPSTSSLLHSSAPKLKRPQSTVSRTILPRRLSSDHHTKVSFLDDPLPEVDLCPLSPRSMMANLLNPLPLLPTADKLSNKCEASKLRVGHRTSLSVVPNLSRQFEKKKQVRCGSQIPTPNRIQKSMDNEVTDMEIIVDDVVTQLDMNGNVIKSAKFSKKKESRVDINHTSTVISQFNNKYKRSSSTESQDENVEKNNNSTPKRQKNEKASASVSNTDVEIITLD